MLSEMMLEAMHEVIKLEEIKVQQPLIKIVWGSKRKV